MTMMSAQEFKSVLKTEADAVENYLSTCLNNRNIPQRLQAAMEYSLLAGGKRLRPVLCLAVAAMLGAKKEHIMPFASAIEYIHSYSLIHDDLPAMDDDDLRRGKPSNHKAFDEATAILAGDGLLTEAFVLMTETAQHISAPSVLSAVNTVAVAAGSGGMVGGQQLDMDFTGRDDVSLEELQTMHAMKTGALIRCSCECGAILGGASAEEQQCIRTYGANIGAAFQIVDDILDETGTEEELGKPVGSDLEQGKNTYPSMLGIEKSRELAQERVDTAIEQLTAFDGAEALFLRKLAQYIIDRVS